MNSPSRSTDIPGNASVAKGPIDGFRQALLQPLLLQASYQARAAKQFCQQLTVPFSSILSTLLSDVHPRSTIAANRLSTATTSTYPLPKSRILFDAATQRLVPGCFAFRAARSPRNSTTAVARSKARVVGLPMTSLCGRTTKLPATAVAAVGLGPGLFRKC